MDYEPSNSTQAVLDEFSRIHDKIKIFKEKIFAGVMHTKRKVELNDEIISISHWSVDIDQTILELKSILKTLSNIYPKITLDDDYIIVEDSLSNYKYTEKKRVYIFFEKEKEYHDRKQLKELYTYLEPLNSKLYIMKEGFKDLQKDLYKFEVEDYPKIIKSIDISKKPTNKITNLINEMKAHISDNDTWKYYRNTFNKLNYELRMFNIGEFYNTSEKMSTTLNNIYKIDSKVAPHHQNICKEFLIKIEDQLELYQYS